MASTTGNGTAATPFSTTWISNGESTTLTTGRGTTADDQDVIDAHREAVAAAMVFLPED